MGEVSETADRGPLSLKRECWARKLGGCSENLNREHVISDSILNLVGGVSLQVEDDLPDILVTSGAQSGQKVVGNSNFVLRYLCEHHNRELSPFDLEAKKFLETLKMLLGKPPAGKGRGFRIHKVNGYFLEKWLAKTFMNVFAFGYQLQKKSLSLHPAYINSARFAESIWTSDRFKKPFGLYYMPYPPRGFKVTVGHQDLKVQLKYTVIEVLEPSGHKFLQYVPMAIALRYLGVGLMGIFNVTGYSDTEMERVFSDQIVALQRRCYFHPPALNLEVGQKSAKSRCHDQIKFLW